MAKTSLQVRYRKAIEAYVGKLKMISDSGTVDYTDTEEVIEKRKARAKKDFNFFVLHYFPHYATVACGQFMLDEAYKVLKNKIDFAIEEWARGHTKSVTFDIFLPIWLHLFHNQLWCMLLIGKNLASAKVLLSDLQAEFATNPQLIQDFGNLVQHGSWVDGDFKTTTGAQFFALGKGQSPRGKRNGPYRPDFVSCDDMDDDKEVENPVMVKKRVQWVLRAVIPAMSPDAGRFYFVNNRIGHNTILTNLADNKAFRHTVVNALDKDNKPTWPERFTQEYFDRIILIIGDAAFQTEFQNNPQKEGTYFKTEYFQWVKCLRMNQYSRIVAHWDLAYSESNTADFNAIPIVGLHGVQKHVLKAFCRQCKMEEAIRWATYVQLSLPKTVIIEWYGETQFWTDAVKIAIDTVALETGYRMPFIFLDRPGKGENKLSRILQMLPSFQRAEWYFNEDLKHNIDMQRVIDQTKGIEPGYTGKDDGPDALEGAGSKLEAGRVMGGDESLPSFGKDKENSRRY